MKETGTKQVEVGVLPRRRGRPARDPEDAEARRRLIRAGLVHLTERGYSASAVNDILKAAGVPKGVFYHYFGSKADFVEALVEAYHEYFASKLDSCFLDESRRPLQRIEAFVESASAGMERHGYRRGCLVGNLGQEASVLPGGFERRLIEILRDWQKRTTVCLRLAQELGEVSEDEDVEEWAQFFWIGWEGAVLRAKLEKSSAALAAFSSGFLNGITCNKKRNTDV